MEAESCLTWPRASAEARAARAPARPGRWLRPRYLVPLLAFAALLPLALNDYQQFVANTMLVYCLVAVGFNIVLGYLGQLAFANAAFFGIGAYATGLAMAHWQLPFPLALLLGAIAGAGTGILVALPALRVRGYYLAIITLAFTELMRWTYVHAGGVTFGATGFNVPPASLFGMSLMSETTKYFLFLGVVALCVVATARLLRSRFGRALVAVRSNEAAAAMLGISVARTNLIAFAWSGLIVGTGGALYAVLNGRVTPETFGLQQMLLHFAIVMFGGLGSLTGSIIGALTLTAAPELLRNFPGLEEIAFSLLLTVVLLFMPNGVGGWLAAKVPALREPLHGDG
jgi:branched-chain amino acid transport system permease protein